MESDISTTALEKSAYLLIGHGRENEQINDTVPKGCTLIVSVGPSELAYTKFRRFIRDPNHVKYLEPVEHIDEIINRYGSVAVFQEGDDYPNFDYQLLGIHDLSGGNYLMMSSGMIMYPFYDGWQTFKVDEVIKSDDKALTVIPQYFEHSSYPTQAHVIDEIKRMARIQGIAPEILPVKLFIDLAKKCDVFKVTQKELFDMVRRDELKPGAFYNFACRTMKPVKKLMISVNENGKKVILPERRLNLFKTMNDAKRIEHLAELNASVSRQMLRGSHLEPILRDKIHNEYKKKENTNTRRVLKQQISEAHIHRRPYIKTTYNKKSGGKRRRRTHKNRRQQ